MEPRSAIAFEESSRVSDAHAGAFFPQMPDWDWPFSSPAIPGIASVCHAALGSARLRRVVDATRRQARVPLRPRPAPQERQAAGGLRWGRACYTVTYMLPLDMGFQVDEYLCEDGSNPYKTWFDGLDAQAAAKVVRRSCDSNSATPRA